MADEKTTPADRPDIDLALESYRARGVADQFLANMFTPAAGPKRPDGQPYGTSPPPIPPRQ
jgi:hypothetical protein